MTESNFAFTMVENEQKFIAYTQGKNISEENRIYLQDIIDKRSYTWYNTTAQTYTIPCKNLTQHGKNLYKIMQRRAEQEKPRAYLTDAILIPCTAGPWYPNKYSQHYSPEDLPVLNHLSNYILSGYDPITAKNLTTSVIRWYGTTTRGTKWVITKSGSMYHYC